MVTIRAGEAEPELELPSQAFSLEPFHSFLFSKAKILLIPAPLLVEADFYNYFCVSLASNSDQLWLTSLSFCVLVTNAAKIFNGARVEREQEQLFENSQLRSCWMSA